MSAYLCVNAASVRDRMITFRGRMVKKEGRYQSIMLHGEIQSSAPKTKPN